MNLKYSELTDILNKISECVEYYEKAWLNNKVFTLYLASGERVKFSIVPQSLPHLLGIDLSVLRGHIKFECEDHLGMLKELKYKDYDLLQTFKYGSLKESDVFSAHIQNKLENFKYNIVPDVIKLLDETLFVSSYKSENSWTVTTRNKKYDYVMVRRLENGKIGLLCLVKNKNQCYAMSNIVPTDEEELNEKLSEILTNQEITLLSGVNVYNINNDSTYTKNLYPVQKTNKFRGLKFYKNKYNCHIDISGDYEYAIDKLGSNRNERLENINYTEDIVEAIANRELINLNNIDDSILINIVNAWNDHICKISGNINDDVKISYTSAIEELKKFKTMVVALEEQNKELETSVSNLKESNAKLSKENEDNQNKLDEIYKILKPRS